MQLSFDDLWVSVFFIQTPTRSPAQSSGGSPAFVQLIKSVGINIHRRAEEGGFTTTCVKGVFCISFLMSECVPRTLKKHLRGSQGVFWHRNHGHSFLSALHTVQVRNIVKCIFKTTKKNKQTYVSHKCFAFPGICFHINRRNMKLQTPFTHAQ